MLTSAQQAALYYARKRRRLRRAAEEIPAIPGPTDISLSATSFDEDALAGSTVATISATSETDGATYTFALTDDADGLFTVEGNLLKLATTLPSGEEIFLRDVTIQGTIDQTGGTSSETFTLTITPVDTSNDSGLGDTDGTLVPVGEFTIAPSVGGNSGALKFKGKSGGLAYFVFDIGAGQPEGVYTYSYIPYFSELSNGGKNAFVGFGFKTGDSFHLVGLKGDGSTGLTKHTLSGTSTASVTSTGSGAPTNGTQAGPNFIQIEISADGLTYTFRTSADGATWADEFTDATPTPFADTGTTQFGLAVFLENSDKGNFSLDVTEWAVTGLAPTDPNFANVVFLSAFDGADGATVATDDSPSAHVLTFNGTAQLDTARKKFGTASLFVNNTGGNFVSAPDSLDWRLSQAEADQFTIEGWVYFDGLKSPQVLMGQWDTAANQRSWAIIQEDLGGAGSLNFYYSTTGSNFPYVIGASAAATKVDGAWHHVAVDKDATSKVRIYVDGVMVGSDVLTASEAFFFNSTAQFRLGQDSNAARAFNGSLDEIRITKGVARYASDAGFTVPTEAYPRSDVPVDPVDPVDPVVLSTTNKASTITLSGGDLTASTTTTAIQSGQSDTALTGKSYFEFLVTDRGAAGDIYLGITQSPVVTDDALGFTARAIKSASWRENGNIYYDGTAIGAFTSFGTIQNGDVVGIAFDNATKKFWVSRNNNWYGFPWDGTGGVTVAAGDYHPAYTLRGSPDSITARFKAADQTYAPPTGFSAVDS